MKIAELREMTREELFQKRRDLEDERFNLNMRRSLKALDNPLRLRQIGREIGCIMTVLREDELGIRKLAERKTSVLDTADADKEKS
ncbi:50S ribosomal protein L29 [candidate division GN15 bacterium]|nr:50S ribosomal protein L29 [candidate division GN15 bacterium]